MEKQICALFDMDGVMLDTEPQYDTFWKHIGDKYNVGVENFEKVIKGNTLSGILKKYFSQQPQSEIDSIIADLDEFELNMFFEEIPGSVRFVQDLKDNGIKVGLVTSSSDTKLIGVNREKQFNELFDTVVSASRVKKGKPDPECFLLAAKDLKVDPKICVVFEDSFAGIEAATQAGMPVVGLATTHNAESLSQKCIKVIPDFSGFSVEDFLNLK